MAFRGLVSLFSRAARIATPYIQKLVRLREPIARIRRTIGARIAGIPREQLEQIVQRERLIREATERVVSVRPAEPVDPDILPAPITAQRRRFAWRIRYQIVHPLTGEVLDQYLTVSTDDILSPEQAMAEARQMAFENYGVEPSDILETEVTTVTHASASQRI